MRGRSKRFTGIARVGLGKREQRRLTQPDVVHEGADSGEASIASSHAVPAFVLEMVEEGEDERRRQILQHKRRGSFAQPVLREREKQPEAIAVGGDGARAHLSLLHQIFDEEPLQQSAKIRGDGVHVCSPAAKRSKRRAASAINSGVAVTYQ